MINHAIILDIEFDEQFVEDLNRRIPQQVKNKLEDVIRQILEHGRLPNSLNAHLAYREDLWIGYITRSNTHWRILFWYDDLEHILVFHRLVEHVEMDRYLDRI